MAIFIFVTGVGLIVVGVATYLLAVILKYTQKKVFVDQKGDGRFNNTKIIARRFLIAGGIALVFELFYLALR